MAMLSGAGAMTHSQEAPGGWTVRLRSPDHVDTTNLQVTYQLTSLAGGGVSGPLRIEPGVREYAIEASVGTQKHPALSFRAIVYCSGYRVVLVNEAPLADGSRIKSVAIDFWPLERLQLTGRWVSAPANIEDFDLEVAYLALWGNRFFGIWDGPIPSLRESVPARSAGTGRSCSRCLIFPAIQWSTRTKQRASCDWRHASGRPVTSRTAWKTFLPRVGPSQSRSTSPFQPI